MTQKKIIYFTVGAKPTSNELAQINALRVYPEITLAVRDLSKIDEDDNPEPADYVCSYAGNDFPENYPVDPYVRTTAANPPAPDVLATQAVITSGVEFLSSDKSGSYVNGFTPTIGAVTPHVVTTMLAG